MPVATPHRGPFASTTIPAGRLHAYIPRLAKVPCDCKLCFQGGAMRARTIKLLSVLDSLSRWANWGAHAEYAYCTYRSATASNVVPCTHICTTRKCNKCSCNDRHETAILSDPVVIHGHCSLSAIAPQNANIKASSSRR